MLAGFTGEQEAAGVWPFIAIYELSQNCEGVLTKRNRAPASPGFRGTYPITPVNGLRDANAARQKVARTCNEVFLWSHTSLNG